MVRSVLPCRARCQARGWLWGLPLEPAFDVHGLPPIISSKILAAVST